MSSFDAFGYKDKRVLVVGGATGMGAATAQLVQDAGAEVVVMDIAETSLPGAKAIHVNLAERSSIDTAVDECGGPVHALFSCAGVADGTPGIERINFIGHRHMIERLMAGDMLPGDQPSGSSPRQPGSVGKPTWRRSRSTSPIPTGTPPCGGSRSTARPTTCSSKQAICGYVASQAFPLLQRGIRINAICPGPTDTPLARANEDLWLAFGADYRDTLGIAPSAPMDQAYPLVFLCSDAASAISGTILITDCGYMSSGVTESFAAATPAANFLLGRY